MREIRTLPQEAELNSSSPCMVKTPPKDRLGSTVNVLLSINLTAMGIAEQIRVCMNASWLKSSEVLDVMPAL